MNCPRCQTSKLIERERTGILIDICSGCRGVWLDRGELDKLIVHALHVAREDNDDDGGDDDSKLTGRGGERSSRERDDEGHRDRRGWWDIFD